MPQRQQGNMRLKDKRQWELQAIAREQVSESVKNGVKTKEM